jgi:2',3'-cyclic-nucleotide 2'-phosphodiesterase (5'-nucleotidase family)
MANEEPDRLSEIRQTRSMYKIIIMLILLLIPLMLPAQNSFSILYIANINATLENCGCGKEPLGGVDRLMTVIKQSREKYHDLLVLSGGDYFNSYSFLSLNTAMLEALQLLQFDLFVPGDQEFVENEQFADRVRTVLGKTWFTSNTGKSKSAVRTFNFSSLRINITAYLSPASFTFIPKPDYLILSRIHPVLPEGDAHIFNCMIFHGSLAEASALARQYPELDLILLGHEQYPSAQSIGHTTILGSGRDGECVVLLQVKRTGTGWCIDRTRIDLTESIPVDAQMSLLVTQYKQKTNIK